MIAEVEAEAARLAEEEARMVREAELAVEKKAEESKVPVYETLETDEAHRSFSIENNENEKSTKVEIESSPK